jgi:DNA-binding response OmpR family regulator
MEDDPGLARLLQKTLNRRGFAVDIAANGEDGLTMINASRYDLLLIDYNMPFLGGIDVIRTLTARKSLLPTIMITGEGNRKRYVGDACGTADKKWRCLTLQIASSTHSCRPVGRE